MSSLIPKGIEDPNMVGKHAKRENSKFIGLHT